MKISYKKLFASVAILALASLACSAGGLLGSDASSNTNASTNASTDTSSNTSESNSSGGGLSGLFGGNPATLNMDDPNLFADMAATNHAIYMELSVTGTAEDGSEVFSQMTISGEQNIDPYASHIRLESNNLELMNGAEYLETATVDNVNYIYSPAFGCTAIGSGTDENPYDDFTDIDTTFLTGELSRVGSEDVNGIATDVYEIKAENISSAESIYQEINQFEEGYLYLSKNDGSIVRIYLVGTGDSSLLGETTITNGRIVYDFYLTPNDKAFDIQIPEECQNAMDDFALPVMDDAMAFSAIGTFYSYTTNYTLEDIVEFYKTEMSALGYTVTTEEVYEGNATLHFESADGAVSLVISPDYSGTAAYQVLLLEE